MKNKRRESKFDYFWLYARTQMLNLSNLHWKLFFFWIFTYLASASASASGSKINWHSIGTGFDICSKNFRHLAAPPPSSANVSKPWLKNHDALLINKLTKGYKVAVFGFPMSTTLKHKTLTAEWFRSCCWQSSRRTYPSRARRLPWLTNARPPWRRSFVWTRSWGK